MMPPPKLLLWELRVVPELVTSFLPRPFAAKLPRGRGEPVLVLPGFAADDIAIRLLTKRLKALDYRAETWGLGRNTGNMKKLMPQLIERVQQFSATAGAPLKLVGWSLGGVFARDLALWAPDMVRYVITLGSPFANDVRATNATWLYELLSGERVEDFAEAREAIAGDLPVPTTSIYSRADGVVNWRTCLLRASERAENIEVHWASHIGLGVNPAALWAVADRLAQPEGQFRPFDRAGPFAIAYAPPEQAVLA